MIRSRYARTVAHLAIVSTLALSLSGCGTSGGLGGFSFGNSQPTPPQEPRRRRNCQPLDPLAKRLVGRWGLASYMNPNDRVRTENAARRPVQAALHIIGRRHRRRHHASGRRGDAAGTAPQGARRAARTISARPVPPVARRIARSSPSTAAILVTASSTRTLRFATATWSMSVAHPRPGPDKA